jgi:hypothetical protein
MDIRDIRDIELSAAFDRGYIVFFLYFRFTVAYFAAFGLGFCQKTVGIPFFVRRIGIGDLFVELGCIIFL